MSHDGEPETIWSRAGLAPQRSVRLRRIFCGCLQIRSEKEGLESRDFLFVLRCHDPVTHLFPPLKDDGAKPDSLLVKKQEV